MYPDFLPKLTESLTESKSVSFAQNIQYKSISTPLNSQAINTSFVSQGEDNTPILLLHGFDSSIFEYRRLLPLLAAQNQTFAVDLLGFGFTDRLANLKINPKAIATHLYYFWKSLINQPVILVGASMGGAAAIDFTLTYPEVVKKLVLIDSAGMQNNPIISKFIFPPLDYFATEFLRRPQVRANISRSAYFDKSFATLDANICARLHLEMPGWNQALISFTKSGGYGNFKQKLPSLQQQTLILWGENDRILGTSDAGKLEGAIANSQLIWIPNCGHVPHLEKSQVTANYILDFIRDN
ncbi:MAG: alpha/beta hydrolase [Okeania sp. SIO2G4]|uniref:alpha/beta fold hydrolase n=1 Tax=unclassified Okeania TaxID=2634635 RepID=UPI0013BE74CE|nr:MULTISPECIES: alpha/beta hydrolase [unclassified Okeania]NEP07193.1 alpha/beta hydrolase [Okeania sp. SIO4D6]NEP42460.1 alpha/beta hydrolase [Okeania sp. SIO2H7]NEP71781.1 alpha/beta hydrolase [Okeania sp. SIO2G5]NEP92447.1 alpha/beta hydrolase [Okeania sp. SIO2F5]NEQ90481.1 alpha/beta hydrolase [Okeania sp. SIO2G4]